MSCQSRCRSVKISVEHNHLVSDHTWAVVGTAHGLQGLGTVSPASDSPTCNYAYGIASLDNRSWTVHVLAAMW